MQIDSTFKENADNTSGDKPDKTYLRNISRIKLVHYHCFDRVGATIKFATDTDEKYTNFFFTEKGVYLKVESICISAKFNKKRTFQKYQKNEFAVVAVIINVWGI